MFHHNYSMLFPFIDNLFTGFLKPERCDKIWIIFCIVHIPALQVIMSACLHFCVKLPTSYFKLQRSRSCLPVVIKKWQFWGHSYMFLSWRWHVLCIFMPVTMLIVMRETWCWKRSKTLAQLYKIQDRSNIFWLNLVFKGKLVARRALRKLKWMIKYKYSLAALLHV